VSVIQDISALGADIAGLGGFVLAIQKGLYLLEICNKIQIYHDVYIHVFTYIVQY